MLPNGTITNAQDLFASAFSTMAKTDIVVFQPAKPIINSESADYNFLYNKNSHGTDVTYQTVSGVYKAIVKYPESTSTLQFETQQARKSEDQVNIGMVNSLVRIRVDVTGAAAVRTCERILINNKVYAVHSSETPRGILTNQVFSFYLKELN